MAYIGRQEPDPDVLVKIKKFQFAMRDDSRKSLAGGAYVMIGDLLHNVLRFGGNLLMTRWLYPEAFGLMLIVNLTLAGLNMMSNVGIRGALFSKYSEVPGPVANTAWSITVVRGIILATICALMAIPISSIYDEPQLATLLLATSLIPAISGFGSPYGIVYEKRLDFLRVAIWNHLPPILSLLATLVWLRISPTIWALVFNNYLTAILTVGMSYLLFRPDSPIRFEFDKQVFQEIFKFGRWAMIATFFAYLAGRGDAIIVSTWISAGQLGVFGLAVSLAGMASGILGKLSNAVIFPLYSKQLNEKNRSIGSSVSKVRMIMFLITIPPVLLLAGFGRELVDLLYDPRYVEAGWMLEILTVGAIFAILTAPIQHLALAHGDSFTHMQISIAQFVILMFCLGVGGYYYGILGLLGGISVAKAATYGVIRIYTTRYKPGGFAFDLFIATFCLSVVAIAWNAKGFPVP